MQTKCFNNYCIKTCALNGRFAYCDCLTPVSYTHLDVYKRQLENIGEVPGANVLMVGDREYDILGAKELGIDSVGVLFGYGDKEELENAGATYIIEKMTDILEIV